MLNWIWVTLIFFAVVFAMIAGNGQNMADVLLRAGDDAVRLTLSLLGSMTLWSGLMEILSETGDLRRIGRCIRRLAAPVYGGLQDEACWDAIGMNMAANLLGLGNAATPAGVRAAQLLGSMGADGMRALAALLVMNNAGLQLLPTTVIAMRQAAGSVNAADIWLPSVVSSLASAAVGLFVLTLVTRKGGVRG